MVLTNSSLDKSLISLIRDKIISLSTYVFPFIEIFVSSSARRIKL